MCDNNDSTKKSLSNDNVHGTNTNSPNYDDEDTFEEDSLSPIGKNFNWYRIGLGGIVIWVYSTILEPNSIMATIAELIGFLIIAWGLEK